VQRDLREIRIDVERLRDELFNITKFFGDWHLARVYQHLSARFHLADWSRTIEGKLRTLNEFYQILKADQNNHLMVILEALIVLLFIIDLVVLIVGLGSDSACADARNLLSKKRLHSYRDRGLDIRRLGYNARRSGRRRLDTSLAAHQAGVVLVEVC